MTDKPVYQHDCEECIFLGNCIGGGRMVDCYAHENPSGRVSILARFGNDGPKYYSTDFGLERPGGHAELWAAASLYRQRLAKKAA